MAALLWWLGPPLLGLSLVDIECLTFKPGEAPERAFLSFFLAILAAGLAQTLMAAGQYCLSGGKEASEGLKGSAMPGSLLAFSCNMRLTYAWALWNVHYPRRHV